jgi:hypothetical protein
VSVQKLTDNRFVDAFNIHAAALKPLVVSRIISPQMCRIIL